MQVGVKINKDTWKITNIIKDTNSWLKYDTLVTLNEEQVKKLEANTNFKELYEELSIYFKETIENLITRNAS